MRLRFLFTWTSAPPTLFPRSGINVTGSSARLPSPRSTTLNRAVNHHEIRCRCHVVQLSVILRTCRRNDFVTSGVGIRGDLLRSSLCAFQESLSYNGWRHAEMVRRLRRGFMRRFEHVSRQGHHGKFVISPDQRAVGTGLAWRLYTISISEAMPIPPPTHSDATPRLAPRRPISFTSVTMMRAPVHPTG